MGVTSVAHVGKSAGETPVMSLSNTDTIMSATFSERFKSALSRRFGTGKPGAHRLHKATGYPQTTCKSWLNGVVPRGDVLEVVTDALGADFVTEVYRTKWAEYLRMAAATDRVKSEMAEIARLHEVVMKNGGVE